MSASSRLVRTVLLVAATATLSSPGWAQDASAPKRVLVLYWYARDYPGNIEFDDLFQAAMRAAPKRIEVYSEYLESNRFPGENQSLVLRDYLQRKYADRRIDIVVANVQATLSFLLRYRDALFADAPIAFNTIAPPSADQLAAGAGATGTVHIQGHRRTLDLALKLHPGTKQVFVISGTTSSDKQVEQVARRELQGYESSLDITYLTDLRLAQLIATVTHLPEKSIILYVWQQLATRNSTVESPEILAAVAHSARVPIYTLTGPNVGRGAVGGYVATTEGNATKLAELTLRLADGTRATDIAVEGAPVVPMFDWHQLQRWDIREDLLPPGSIIRFREPTMWQQYKWRIVAAIVLIILQGGLIAALLVQRRRARRAQRELQEDEGQLEELVEKRTAALAQAREQALAAGRAEEALRRSEARWNAAIESLGTGVVIATDTEEVIYRNPAALAMHGFTSGERGLGPLQEMTRIFQLWTLDGRLLTLDEWPSRRIRRGETVDRLELRLRRLDQGWEKIVSYSGAMVESATGERLMFVSLQDLTDQRKAEQSLRESEERLRLLGDNLPDSAVYQFVHELGGGVRFTYCSAGIERLNGVTAEAVLRDESALHSQILPEHMECFVEAKSRSKRDLSDFDIEVLMRRSDGEIRWIHFHSRPRRLPDGRTIWDGVQTDVTARKQAEDALKKQAELLRLSHDAMIVWKLDGAIESWNFGAERLYGYSELEVAGKVAHTLLAPRFPEPWGEILRQMRILGSWEGEMRQETRDRREVVVSARIQLIKGSDGIDRVLEVDRDVTEARRAQMEAFARQKLESLGTLASGIAHDFNNLLGAVLAQAELAAAGLAAGTPPHGELEAIREVAIRGSDIVRQLMIYAGKESDVLELIDISKTVEEMYGLLKSAISKRAALVTDLSEHLPAVKARTAQLRQVLMNLVVNASEAIKDGSGVIRVTTECVTLGRTNTDAKIEGLAEGDYVQLEVSDTGSGMSHDVQARIFDPFFSTKSTGRGLGLPVIHGIVRSLGGAIRVESEVGKGTTFQILLPSQGTAARQISDTLAGTEEELHRSSEATVLIVEDEAQLRFAVKKMLGKAGFTVLEAADGSEAVKLLHSTASRIDLLLLDMTIPGCSSHEVLREAVGSWPQVKVILTSAYSEEMVKGSLSAPQVRGFIRKPFQLGTLLSTLRNALSS